MPADWPVIKAARKFNRKVGEDDSAFTAFTAFDSSPAALDRLNKASGLEAALVIVQSSSSHPAVRLFRTQNLESLELKHNLGIAALTECRSALLAQKVQNHLCQPAAAPCRPYHAKALRLSSAQASETMLGRQEVAQLKPGTGRQIVKSMHAQSPGAGTQYFSAQDQTSSTLKDVPKHFSWWPDAVPYVPPRRMTHPTAA